MTPTMELRFVERKVTDVLGRPYEIKQVLQQKWVGNKYHDNGTYTPNAEQWCDVPLVKEEA